MFPTGSKLFFGLAVTALTGFLLYGFLQEWGTLGVIGLGFAPGSDPGDPTQLSPAGRKLYADVYLYGSAQYDVPGLFGALSAFRAEVRREKRAAAT